MQIVSAVYPNANVDVSGRKVVLHPSRAPLERKLIGPHLRLVGPAATKTARTSSVSQQETEVPKPVLALIDFPSGSLRYAENDKAFYSIGLTKGAPWDVDQMAAEFRRGCPTISRKRAENEWLRMWEAFVIAYAARRTNRIDS
jgi:hypothetical protein